MQHVRISKRGREILNNKTLAGKLVDTIQANKRRLSEGETVKIDGEKLCVRLVTCSKKFF